MITFQGANKRKNQGRDQVKATQPELMGAELKTKQTKQLCDYANFAAWYPKFYHADENRFIQLRELRESASFIGRQFA